MLDRRHYRALVQARPLVTHPGASLIRRGEGRDWRGRVLVPYAIAWHYTADRSHLDPGGRRTSSAGFRALRFLSAAARKMSSRPFSAFLGAILSRTIAAPDVESPSGENLRPGPRDPLRADLPERAESLARSRLCRVLMRLKGKHVRSRVDRQWSEGYPSHRRVSYARDARLTRREREQR